MYTAYYGFHERPFALTPDPRYLFLSESHREVLGHLIYGIEQGEGFMAISGEVGTGKTTLSRTLLERVGGTCEIAFLFNPALSPTELLKSINGEFGISTFGESLPELVDVLNTFLLERKSEGRRVLLIVDEAQNLPVATLEQIRLLSNLETETSKLIQIILLGQPELDRMLETQELRQLRQRISVWWRLGPLTAVETRDYVRHRLRIAAGGDRPLFSEGALRRIHRLSGGVPRLINILCDRALLAGYAEDALTIGRRTVDGVAREVRATSRTQHRFSARALWWAAAGVALALAGGAILLARDGAPLDIRAALGGGSRVQAAPPPSLPVPVVDAPRTPVTVPSEPDSAEPAEARHDPAASGPPSAGRVALEALMELRTPGAAWAAAVDATLETWGFPPANGGALGPTEARALLNEYGLRTLPVDDLAALRGLDLPGLLALSGPEGRTHAMLIRSLEPGYADLRGAIEGETLRVPISEIERRWVEGWAVWRDFETLPGMLETGDANDAVYWLQAALSELGFYDGPRHARFDEATAEAVRSFQRASELRPDGRLGPRTKIRLYEALPSYVVPVLVREDVDLARSR